MFWWLWVWIVGIIPAFVVFRFFDRHNHSDLINNNPEFLYNGIALSFMLSLMWPAVLGIMLPFIPISRLLGYIEMAVCRMFRN